jgi:hypothetical protein
MGLVPEYILSSGPMKVVRLTPDCHQLTSRAFRRDQ